MPGSGHHSAAVAGCASPPCTALSVTRNHAAAASLTLFVARQLGEAARPVGLRLKARSCRVERSRSPLLTTVERPLRHAIWWFVGIRAGARRAETQSTLGAAEAVRLSELGDGGGFPIRRPRGAADLLVGLKSLAEFGGDRQCVSQRVSGSAPRCPVTELLRDVHRVESTHSAIGVDIGVQAMTHLLASGGGACRSPCVNSGRRATRS